MANEFEDLVKRELPLRPVMVADGPQETILVRRGNGPRLFVSVDIEEGQVIGKEGGVIKGLNISGGSPLSFHSQISPGNTGTVGSLTAESFSSRVLIFSIETSDKSTSWQVFAKVNKQLTDIDYNFYGRLGDNIPHKFNLSIDEDNVIIEIENLTGETLSCTVTAI